MYANITANQLVSVMSLHVFASTDDVAPVITTLQLRRKGEQLVVHTTDRYCLARGVYDVDVEHDSGDVEGDVYLSAKTAKSFLPMVKKINGNAMVIVDDETITVKAGPDIVIPLETIAQTYPPVDRLIPEDVHAKPTSPTGMVSIKPDYITRLSKVILPTMHRQDRNQPWIFTIDAGEGGKPKPMVCIPRECGDQIVVLIQPNIIPAGV